MKPINQIFSSFFLPHSPLVLSPWSPSDGPAPSFPPPFSALHPEAWSMAALHPSLYLPPAPAAAPLLPLVGAFEEVEGARRRGGGQRAARARQPPGTASRADKRGGARSPALRLQAASERDGARRRSSAAALSRERSRFWRMRSGFRWHNWRSPYSRRRTR